MLYVPLYMLVVQPHECYYKFSPLPPKKSNINSVEFKII